MNTLAHVVRGDISESRHAGFVAVADSTGHPLLTSGPLDEDRVSFLRSSAKPIQAIPLIETGAADHFGLTPAEIALACASHSGQDEHVRQVSVMLEKGGLSLDQLLCGAHYPYHIPTQERMLRAGEKPTNLNSNCSGKHTGMLLVCKHMGWPTETYTEPEHPLQQLILKTVAEFAGLRPQEVATGRDGCSVVCFGMTTVQMATSFARLADPDYWREVGRPERAEAVERITYAMWSYPFNVGGTGRNDTDLMEIAPKGQVFCKAGAEAVWCLGFPQKKLGMALKIEDGATRAEPVIAVEALRQARLLDQQVIATFESRQSGLLKNVRGIVVGHYQPAFDLKNPERWNNGD
ncbi:MAG TPA: asparaginase [Chloroflexia bacterium]|nr:asparaginase [Chloroflexia bacterium]